MHTIIKRIKKERLRAGLTQKDMADHLNLSQSAYAKIETGQTRIDIERLFEICRIISLRPMDLIDDELNHNSHGEDVTGQLFKSQQKEYRRLIKYLKDEVSFLRNVLIKKTS